MARAILADRDWERLYQAIKCCDAYVTDNLLCREPYKRFYVENSIIWN